MDKLSASENHLKKCDIYSIYNMSNSKNTNKNFHANDNSLAQSNIRGNSLSHFKGKSRKELLNYILQLENKNSNLTQRIKKLESKSMKNIDRLSNPRGPRGRPARFAKYKISADLAKKTLKFKTKKALLKYIVDNNIEVKQFQNEEQFVPYMKEHIRNTEWQKIEKLNELADRLIKNNDEYLLKIIKPKGVLLKKIEVKPLQGPSYWVINHPRDPRKINEIHNLIESKRYQYGSSNIDKSLKMIYNNNITEYNDIIHTLTNLFNSMGTMFRLLFSFGYVLETEHDDNPKKIYTYSVYHPGKNYFLDENVIIKNKNDFNKKVLSNLIKDKIIEKIEVPNTKTKIIGIYSMAMKVTLLDFPIGSKVILPSYIKYSTNIVGLEGIEYHLCFWGCLAIAEGCRRDKYIRKAKQLFKEYYSDKKSIENYIGFDFHKELDDYEKFNTKYAINIINYHEDKTANVIRHSQYNDSRKPIYLNLYMDHFSYITDIKKLIKLYICETCAKKFNDNKDLAIHQDKCSKEQIDIFCKYPQIYEPQRNPIIELCEWFNVELDFKYDYIIVYDLESILVKCEEKYGEKTNIVQKHMPVSVSVYDNIPGYNREYWYCNEDPKRIVKQFFEHLDKLCERASELMVNKMKPLIDAINGYYHEKRRNKYLKIVEDYCKSVPIIGFNSGFYDTGIMLSNNFMQEILVRDNKPMAIKTGNRYKFIKAANFLFLDQVQYLPAGYNLDQFMKAFDGGEQKGFFPYEWLDTYDKLNTPFDELKIEYFDSKLKNSKMKQR